MKSTTAVYFPRIDHLRFVAALMVLVWHGSHHRNFIDTAYVPRFWPLSIFEEGHTGVALFMTLSGFIFYLLAHDKRIIFGEFVRNRLLRIAPLFVVWTLFFYYVTDLDPIKLLASTFGLLNKGPTIPGTGWTVIIEFQFYLLFPFLLLMRQQQGVRYLVLLIGLFVSFRTLIWIDQGNVQEFAYRTIFGRMDQFLFGILGAEAYLRYRRQLSSLALFVLLATIWMGIYHQFNSMGGYYHFGQSPTKSWIWIFLPTLEGCFYAAIIASYLAQDWSLPSIFDRGLAWLGTLSFSIYLTHWPIMFALSKSLDRMGWLPPGGARSAGFFVLLLLPIVIASSAATYYLIEKPFLTFRRNYLLPLSDPK